MYAFDPFYLILFMHLKRNLQIKQHSEFYTRH